MKVHITDTDLPVINKKSLLILTRPWLGESEEWKENEISPLDEADFALIPFSVNFYFENRLQQRLLAISQSCQKQGKKAYAYISGDFGVAFPEFSNITYFRMGGFASQLSDSNKGFPVSLSDHFQAIYQMENPVPLKKSLKPIVGFCGHASKTWNKRGKELLKCALENGRRALQRPIRKDWEPLFASAYERAKLLSYLKDHQGVQCNFIYRNHYRAGAQSEAERRKTTLEYYDNLANSDYVLCVRGAGNFSVRLYESLMMGKIPLFVNTDCLLPFPDLIPWKKHMVWVEWKDRHRIGEILLNFHQNISNADFEKLQKENRKLWKQTLSIQGMLEIIKNDL